MKQIFRDIGKDGRGFIVLLPQEPEDMWHGYNLILVGDNVKSTTLRRVQSETITGSSERIRLTLTIQVESIDFDSQMGVLRLKGKNLTESEYIKLGAYHTLDLELNREFTLYKSFWDTVALDRINSACDPTQYADLGAIVMQEGLAHVCLITPTMTITRARIEISIPRKGKGSTEGHENGLNRFFDIIIQSIEKHFNFSIIKCIIIASPGFVREQFYSYMMLEAERKNIRAIIENKSKFVSCHCSSGQKHAVQEILSDQSISSKLSDTKASSEVQSLNDFYAMLKVDSNRAFYGLKHILMANERLAIQTLLITDELFRSSDILTRKKYVELVEEVKSNGGVVKIFSTMHTSGEQLSKLSGIAAILRFPIPEIEDDEDQISNNNEENI